MDLSQWVSMAIPVASFGAMFVGVFLFVKNKAQMDALKEGSAAWKNLAEGYKETIEQLEAQMERMEAEIEDLKHSVEEQRKAAEADQLAMRKAIDELIAGFERAGYERVKKS